MGNRERISGAQVLHNAWVGITSEPDARDDLDELTRALLDRYEPERPRTMRGPKVRDDAPFEELIMGRKASRTETHETVGKRGRRSLLPESVTAPGPVFSRRTNELAPPAVVYALGPGGDHAT